MIDRAFVCVDSRVSYDGDGGDVYDHVYFGASRKCWLERYDWILVASMARRVVASDQCGGGGERCLGFRLVIWLLGG